MKKRGLSPVIATVLLIGIVIVIGLIVFLWFRGISEEAITKFDGTNVKLVCDDIQFQAQYSSGKIFITNIGNVPIYRMKAELSGGGSFSTVTLGDSDSSWPNLGINQGEVYSGSLSASGSNAAVLIPVLIGTSESGEKTYTCEERHGYKVDL